MNGLLNKTTVIVAISCILIGRYALAPKPKVVTKEVVKIVEVEKKQTKKKKETTQTTNPNGSTTTQITETEDTTIDRTTDIASTSTSASKSGVTLGLLAIKDVTSFSSSLQYGATVSVPLIGSLNVIGLATTSKQVGLGLSIEF
jgi:hypothetical protein